MIQSDEDLIAKAKSIVSDHDGTPIAYIIERLTDRIETLSTPHAGDELPGDLIAAPKEPTSDMLKAVHGSIGAYLATLGRDHPWRAKGWLQGAKMAAEAKAYIRYKAMLASISKRSREPEQAAD